jgi:hypothetical protein
MSDVDGAVQRFLARLPEWARPETMKIVHAVQAEAFAAGVAHSEMVIGQRVMASEFLREHFAAETLRQYQQETPC